MSQQIINNMRDRAAQCRRLAAIIHDQDMARQLAKWADEIEGDIVRLEEEAGGEPKKR